VGDPDGSNGVEIVIHPPLRAVDVRTVSGPDTTQRAATLLSDAFARRYRYPGGFGGWSAQATFGPGDTRHEATVAVCGPGDARAVPSVRLSGHEMEWLAQELRSLSRVLYGHEFVGAEGRFTMSLDDTPHPLGPLVILHDDPHGATFRVRKHRLTLATRRSGSLLEMVRVERWHVRPDGRWLPSQWTVEVYDDGRAQLLRTDRYWDLWWPLDGEIVPQLRRVETLDALGIRLAATLHLREWQPIGL